MYIKCKNIKCCPEIYSQNIPPLKDEELHNCLKELKDVNSTAAILSFFQPFENSRIPKKVDKLPRLLTDLHDPAAYQNWSLEDSRNADIDFSITLEEKNDDRSNSLIKNPL